MLCSLKSPTSQFDLLGLAVDGVVSAGRETSTAVRLDCPEVPFLLSRRHALFTVQPDGSMAVMDCNSTNGTYCSRANQPLRKLPPCTPWILEVRISGIRGTAQDSKARPVQQGLQPSSPIAGM
eukprot:1139105-Pelagomonas_calceolata.AAC.9